VTLTVADAQRRALRQLVAAQREEAARIGGELEAARRIQMGILPRAADAVGADRRLSAYAFLEPALVVGGDLYDVLRLDEDRLFVLIGDVSGKGLASSLFMAVSKTLCKSAALRRRGELAAMLREVNAEISRDNQEGLFVAVFAAIIDARTGALDYCSAGHEDPYLLVPGGCPPARLPADGGGPPLCVVEDFAYTAGHHRLQPGEALCVVTDGITEARDGSGQLYGRARLERLLASLGSGSSVDEVGEAIRADVARFSGSTPPSDDRAIVVLRWHGGAAP
jgi:serine phosphatase RsbU (regulator of sigma subunit)